MDQFLGDVNVNSYFDKTNYGIMFTERFQKTRDSCLIVYSLVLVKIPKTMYDNGFHSRSILR